ncbi:MAG TPA: dehydrogenase, partial [Oceanospirillaceae bacterium]|nr:dehydrogenase [Oceanospirillaceae bacterium]
ADHGIRPVGGRALLSLRVEKGYGSWGREYSTEYWPQEVGLDRLIKLDKAEDFIGKQAYIAIKDHPAREKLVMLEIETPHDADASGGEPIFTIDGTPVGKVSSGAYGHSLGKSYALAFIAAEYLQQEEFDVAILGLPHRAKLLQHPPFDPQGQRLRS